MVTTSLANILAVRLLAVVLAVGWLISSEGGAWPLYIVIALQVVAAGGDIIQAGGDR